jgi:hypothetical protein
MTQRTAIVIGAACGIFAAVWTGWWLLQWLGFGFWFLVLIVPFCLGAMQGVGSMVAKILMGISRR